MKIVVYCSESQNIPIFEQKNQSGFFDIKYVESVLTMDSVDETIGYDGILINTLCIITDEIAARLQQNGVRYIASRAAGKDHMDLTILKKYGLCAANVPSYSPNAISELTIMLVLNLLRHMKPIQRGVDCFNFNTDLVCGRELKSMQVGVLGCGNIGLETLRILKGFNCKTLVLKDLLAKTADGIQEIEFPLDSRVLEYAEYADLDTILTNSDIIIFHMPLLDSTYHLVDKAFINRCKEGVMLINASRGALFHAADVLEALESEQVSCFGFDVYEGEERFVCKKSSKEEFEDGIIEKLCAREDVVFTPHIGYYTKEALRAMITISLDNLQEFYETQACKNNIDK